MRVGTVCFATVQGLGILAKSFFDNGIVTDPIVVRHGKRHTYMEWYPEGTPEICSFPTGKHILKAIEKLDVMLFFETAFDWKLIPLCRKMGVKTVLVPMYECTPKVLPYVPDRIISPSLLDQDYYPGSTFIPIPVDVEWEERQKALRFLHNGGNLGLKGNKGTYDLVCAMRHVQSPIDLTIRVQDGPSFYRLIETIDLKTRNDSRIKYEIGTIDYAKLRTGYDVYVAPEKLSALCLPLQEARASGMMILATDRHPHNKWLPKEELFPAMATSLVSLGNGLNAVPMAVIDPKEIAKKIDGVYDTDITSYSIAGKEWAQTMSWDALRPVWLEALRETCTYST